MGDILEFTHDRNECSPQIHMDEDEGHLCPACESQCLSEALMIQGSKWRVERLQTRHIMQQLIDCLKAVEPVEGNDDAVFKDFWEEMQMGEIVIRAEAWMEDHPEIKVI